MEPELSEQSCPSLRPQGWHGREGRLLLGTPAGPGCRWGRLQGLAAEGTPGQSSEVRVEGR